ncbi:hypothetical protein I6F07_28885 [Ensifer sp. IC4062]|nr:hypothetical protein [Ensifer sp. IC4062]
MIAFIYAIIASNWNLRLGHCGIFNFGHLTFFGIRVYTAAVLTKTGGVNPWLAIPVGGARTHLRQRRDGRNQRGLRMLATS